MTPQEANLRKFRQVRAYEALYDGRRPAVRVSDRLGLHDWAANHLGKFEAITYLEFGVFAGQTITRWASNLASQEARLFGFDSFEGLPEVWDVGFKTFDTGTFSRGGAPPAFEDARVAFVTGWFQNTVPSFLKNVPPPLNHKVMVHFDADLYSSTLFTLTTLWHYIFDYHFIMDDFSQDDLVALHDFTMAYPVTVKWLAEHTGDNGRPFQAFGRLTRKEFTLKTV